MAHSRLLEYKHDLFFIYVLVTGVFSICEKFINCILLIFIPSFMHLVLHLKFSEKIHSNLAWDQYESMLNSVCVCQLLSVCWAAYGGLFRIMWKEGGCFLNYTDHPFICLSPIPFPYNDIFFLDFIPPSLSFSFLNKPWLTITFAEKVQCLSGLLG